MIYDLSHSHKESVIANNEGEAKRNVNLFNPLSKFLEAK